MYNWLDALKQIVIKEKFILKALLFYRMAVHYTNSQFSVCEISYGHLDLLIQWSEMISLILWIEGETSESASSKRFLGPIRQFCWFDQKLINWPSVEHHWYGGICSLDQNESVGRGQPLSFEQYHHWIVRFLKNCPYPKKRLFLFFYVKPSYEHLKILQNH